MKKAKIMAVEDEGIVAADIQDRLRAKHSAICWLTHRRGAFDGATIWPPEAQVIPRLLPSPALAVLAR